MHCDAIRHDTRTSIAFTGYHSVKVRRRNQHDPCLSGTTSSRGHGRHNHYLSSIGVANMVVSLDVFRGVSDEREGYGSADRNDRRNAKSESESKKEKDVNALPNSFF